MSRIPHKSVVITGVTGVSIMTAVFFIISQAAPVSSLATTSREEAIAIALADNRVQSIISGKEHRVLEVTEGDPEKGGPDLTVAIYVYPDAKAVAVPVDITNKRVIEVIETPNTIGPVPTTEEEQAALKIAIADQRIQTLTAGKQYGTHSHHMATLSPIHPCHAHRCIAVGIDLNTGAAGTVFHYAVANVDLVTKKVTGILLQPETLGINASGQNVIAYNLDDYLGRTVSIEEAKRAASLMLQDQQITSSLQSKDYAISVTSNAPNRVTVSSTILQSDGPVIRNYVQAEVDLGTDTIARSTISAFAVVQANEAAQTAMENPAIKQSLEKMGVNNIVIEPVQGDAKVLRIQIEPFTGKGIDALVDLQSKSVISVVER